MPCSVKRLLAGVVIIAVVAPLYLLIRARFLPEVPVPVFRYSRIASGGGEGEVSPELFFSQIADLKGRGYQTVSQDELRRYRTWGIPLPYKPCLIVFEVPDKDLLWDPARYESAVSMPIIAEDILKEAGFSAIVALPGYGKSGAPATGEQSDMYSLLSWDEIKKASERGIFQFAVALDANARGDAGESIAAAKSALREHTGTNPEVFVSLPGADLNQILPAVKKVGFGLVVTDKSGVLSVKSGYSALELPSLKVYGGTDAFGVTLLQNGVRRDQFGTLRLTNNGAPALPVAIVAEEVADPDGDEPKLLVEQLVPPLAEGEHFNISVPAGFKFPIVVYLQDETGYITLAEPVILQKEDAKKAPGYRPPILDAEDIGALSDSDSSR